MYDNVWTKIKRGNKLTDYINCTAGVYQGDVCSLILFSLFKNELAIQVIKNGKHGGKCYCDLYELFILLLADDVILVSETITWLQTQINNLQRAAAKLELTVTMDKSNIIVFRKGGYLCCKRKMDV